MNSRRSAFLIDAGTGNLRSVYHALVSLGFEIQVTYNPEDLHKREPVILPGVGAFGHFMAGLHVHDLEAALCEVVQRGDPFMGICVGMQALFESSSEAGNHPGLGLLPGKVSRFADMSGYKVPHTGWNQIWPVNEDLKPALQGLKPGEFAYFNHSYYCLPDVEQDVAALTDYGISFTSVVCRGNVWGVQFHPEKSQKVGLKILSNFMKQ